MSLLDRFRPRWRDPEPKARRGAVRQLDDLATLRQLADHDEDGSVRAAAAARVRELLVEAAVTSETPVDGEAALAQLVEESDLAAVAASAAHATVRAAALDRITSDRLLRDVVRTAAAVETRSAALARIDDPSVLRQLATSDASGTIALAALERIDDPALLADIAQQPGASRAVRRRAEERLPADAQAQLLGTGEVRGRQHELCVQLESFADQWECDGVAERIHEVAGEWATLADTVPPKEEVATRFARAREAAQRAVATWERRREEALHVEAALDARRTVIRRIEALSGDDDLRALAEARRAWAVLEPASGPEVVDLEHRFRAACAEYERRRTERGKARTLEQELEAIVADATRLADAPDPPSPRAWKAVAERWRARVSESDESAMLAALRPRFEAAAERVRERRQRAERDREHRARQNLARLDALCTRMVKLAEAETLSLRAGARDLRAAEKALEDLGPLPSGESRATWKRRLADAHDRLLRRRRQDEEAEGWRRFANAGVQDELIGRVEALLASGDLAAASKQFGEIQREWQRAATAPRDRAEELWSRYRTARNELRRRIDSYQADNLSEKQALCDRVAPLVDSTDWNATADEIKRLQAEWKAIGPVPARHAAALWRRFREPCDRFFARRKEHFGRVDAEREENAKRKRALCEQAEALAGSTDWDETARTLKRLQAKWKEIGPVPRAENEPLWRRFRGACDHFFDRSSRRDELEREEQIAAAETACAALEASVGALASEAAASDAEIGAQLDAAWSALHALDDEPGPDTRALGDRFHTACERLGEACPSALRGTRVDPEATRGRREKICARVESLLEVALARPRELSLEERALRLREMLAAKTIGGTADPEEQRRQDAADEITRLRAQWTRLGPPLGEEARAAAERFARACARFDAVPRSESD